MATFVVASWERTVVRALLAVAIGMALLAGCSSSSPAPSPPPPTSATGGAPDGSPLPSPPDASGTATTGAAPTSPSPAADDAPTAAPTGAPAWAEVAAGFGPLVATLEDPRDGAQLVVELTGRIKDLKGDVLLDLSDRVTTGGERGLLDATTTPEGDRLVVHYSGRDGATTLSSFPVADGGGPLADATAETVLLELEQPAGNHNGGSVVFGPDGWLYLALGDGGRANDAFGNGADPTTPLGAILRLDVTSDPTTAAPAPDNPFTGAGDGDERVWAHGLRNPWRIATDGERWFVADVGQDAVEEITIVPATAGPHDLGWPDWEGDVCRVDQCETDSRQPVATFTHEAGACSIIGAAVAVVPEVDRGAFFSTDLCDHRVWRLDPDTGELDEDAALPDGATPLALDVDVDGRVVALTQDGRMLRRDRAEG